MNTETDKQPTDRTPDEMREDALIWSRAGYPPVAISRYRDAADQIERLESELAAAHEHSATYQLEIERLTRERDEARNETNAMRRILEAIVPSGIEPGGRRSVEDHVRVALEEIERITKDRDWWRALQHSTALLLDHRIAECEKKDAEIKRLRSALLRHACHCGPTDPDPAVHREDCAYREEVAADDANG